MTQPSIFRTNKKCHVSHTVPFSTAQSALAGLASGQSVSLAPGRSAHHPQSLPQHLPQSRKKPTSSFIIHPSNFLRPAPCARSGGISSSAPGFHPTRTKPLHPTINRNSGTKVPAPLGKFQKSPSETVASSSWKTPNRKGASKKFGIIENPLPSKNSWQRG